MTNFSIIDIKREILNELRNANIFTIAQRGVTTVTQNFTATAGQTVFTLTYEPRNIRSVTVNSVSKYYFNDYEFNAVSKTLTLNTGATVSDPVAIQYDYGTTGAGGDKIFPDYPRGDLTFKSFPRIAIDIIGIDSRPIGLGATNYMSDLLLSVWLWVPADTQSSVGGTEYLDTIMDSIRSAIMTRHKSFYTFRYIQVSHTGPVVKDKYDKIIQRTQDFVIRFVVE
jgi:hypothetical protein